jgi:hypothetical protein
MGSMAVVDEGTVVTEECMVAVEEDTERIVVVDEAESGGRIGMEEGRSLSPLAAPSSPGYADQKQ